MWQLQKVIALAPIWKKSFNLNTKKQKDIEDILRACFVFILIWDFSTDPNFTWLFFKSMSMCPIQAELSKSRVWNHWLTQQSKVQKRNEGSRAETEGERQVLDVQRTVDEGREEYKEVLSEGKVKGGWKQAGVGAEDKMPSYVTTIKADAWRCEPDPCGGQRTTGRSSSCLRDMWILWGMRFSIKQKLEWRGSHRESALSFTRPHQRKILLGHVGPVKAKWIIDLGCGGATGVWTSKQSILENEL